MLGTILGVLETNLDTLGHDLAMFRTNLDVPAPINPVCCTRGATKWLVQLDVLCIVAAKQQEIASIYIFIYPPIE